MAHVLSKLLPRPLHLCTIVGGRKERKLAAQPLERLAAGAQGQ